MDIAPLLDELFAMTFHGIKPGLERTEALCDTVGNPQWTYPVIHVAGTNGKGSTCAMLAAILQKAGLRVGLYTSPHIRRFNERIRVNGTMIPDEDIARLARPLMDAAAPIGGTFFEVTTAMAFAWLAERNVDIAVIETGLGGRLDSTNVVSPFVSIITSIDMDHMEYLGDSLEKIAREKAGIIKSHAPAIVGEQRRSLRHVFEERAHAVHAPLTFAHDVVSVEVDKCHPDLSMTVNVIDDQYRHVLTTDLCGAHQAQNIATVMAALPAIRQLVDVSDAHVTAGLRSVRATTGLEGRIQLLRATPPLVLDVSHNPAGIAALIDTLRQCGYGDTRWNVIFGAMSDKDVRGMLQQLAPVAETLHCCSINYKRAMHADELARIATEIGIADVIPHASVREAIRHVADTTPCLIAGSFYLAEEWLEERGVE